MKNLINVILTIIILVFSRVNLNAQAVTTDWVVNNFPGIPVGVMTGLDQNDNVLVTGQSGDHNRIITKKYDTNGNLIWERTYSISGYAVAATWISIDNSGNIIVTGYPHNFSSNPIESGLLTLKYDNNGNLLWDKLIQGTWAFAVRSIVDQSGNIYVTGRAWQYTATYDFVTVKYAPDGTQLWFDTFDQNSGFHTPNSMDLDHYGNLFITGGGQSGGLITVMYNNSGVRQWVREKSGTAGNNIKSDGNGGIFVTGSFYDYNTGTSNDIMLLKYDLAGNLVWQRFYDFGNSEYGNLINIDSHSNIFITGFGALQGAFPGWLTVKVDPSGNLLWYKRFKFNSGWEEYPYFALTGPEDEIYITGNVGVAYGGTTYHGMETVRYNSDGSNPWVAGVNLYAGIGKGLALGSDLSLYGVGMFYYSVIKYSQSLTLNVKTSIEGFYDPVQNKMIKDTVKVYLKSSSSPYNAVDSALAILDSNGNGNFNFPNAANTVPYYIVINHRNSVETWSAAANSFSSGNVSYDFTISSGQAFGNNQILKGAKYCIYSGDVNKDGLIDAGDLALVDNAVIFSLSGYVNTDADGNNFTDAGDLSIVDNNTSHGVIAITP